MDVTGRLTPQRRTALGLPQPRQPATDLPALGDGQWADPEAVAARYVLVDTNYSVTEDPRAVNARRALYAGDRLRADLATSSSAGAGTDELRHQGGELHGEILGLVTTERSEDTAAVSVMVRRTLTANGEPVGTARIGFYGITLVGDAVAGHWLVAGVEIS